jgi:capsular polysaccharide biosynthesis protein
MPVYLTPPANMESLASMLARFGGSLPAAKAAVHIWALLPGGRVYGAGNVLAPDGSAVAADISNDFGSPPGHHWLQTYAYIREPRPLAGVTAVAAVNLGSRYAHWLLEELPRLLALPPDAADTIIANTGTPFACEAFESGRFPGRVIAATRHGHHVCEQLLIPVGFGAPGAVTARELGLIEAFAAPLMKNTTVCGDERLYLTRRHAGRRRVANDGELESLLATRGFKAVAPERLSWRDQLALFAGAREIVAPHGAGLANLVFCRPGTRVLELFHPGYQNPCYERLARLKALEYQAIVPAASDEQILDPRAGRLDIVADLSAVRAALG